MTLMNRLKDIFGQDVAIANLAWAMAAGRLPHGLIFAGPEGVGKATTARRWVHFSFVSIRNRMMPAENAQVASAIAAERIRIIT